MCNKIPNDRNKSKTAWWISPHGVICGFLVPMIFLIWYLGFIDSDTLTVRGIRFFDSFYLMLGVLILFVMAVSSWLGSKISLKSTLNPSCEKLTSITYLIGFIALAAYVFWFREIIFVPANFVRTITGEGLNREEIGAVQGVSSFVNFTPVFFSLYVYIVLNFTGSVSRKLHFVCIFLVFFSIARVFIWAERLALIEASLPFILGFYFILQSKRSSVIKYFILLGPFAALPILILYFGLAEFFRSWGSATYAGKTGFWEFAIGRMGAYYYTSLNNGAGLLATADWPTYKFENVLLWLHKFPIIGGIFSYYVGLNSLSTNNFLLSYGDPEFNNPSGIYSVLLDLGLFGGLTYFIFTSFLSGIIFKGYKEQNLICILLYPIVLLSIFEIFRYPYLGAPRTFTWFLGIFIVSIYLLTSRDKTIDIKT